MITCNCNVQYNSEYDYYTVSLGLPGNGLDTISLAWDTGANRSILYSSYLSKVKNLDQVKLDTVKEIIESGKRNNYICRSFSTVSKENVLGILCCTHNIYINHLHLKNFYFYFVPADKKPIGGLLGTDFISCCERQATISSDEIFTQFDEELYERKYQDLITIKGKKPYDLNFLMDTKKETKSKSGLVNISWPGIEDEIE